MDANSSVLSTSTTLSKLAAARSLRSGVADTDLPDLQPDLTDGSLRVCDDGPVADAGVPLLVRRRPRRRLQYMLEGAGWASVRMATDLIASLLAVLVALLFSSEPLAHPTLFGFPLAVTVMLSLRGMYRRRVREVMLDAIAPIAGAVSVAAMAVLAWEVFVHGDSTVAPQLGRAWVLAVLLVCSGRTALALFQRRARLRLDVGRTTLIVGAGTVGVQVAHRLREHPEYGLVPVGYLDADPLSSEAAGERLLPVLGAPAALERVVAETGAEHLILAFSSVADRALLRLVRRCEQLGVEVSLVPRLFESITDRVALDRLGGLPLLGLRAVDPKGWQFQLKYAIDRPVALAVVLLFSPVMLLAAIAVKLSSRGPILYRQRRVGRDGTVFDMLKFRSMHTSQSAARGFSPPRGHAPGGVEGADRRTLVGRLMRRTAIDELPQLFNVLKGEMSLVGPRPERPEYVELFELDQYRYSERHRVKSGITGWAQVHGLRGQTSLADRIEWDNAYIENWSLWLDLKVLLMTAGAIVRSGKDA